MILDGKVIAQKIYDDLKLEISSLSKKPKIGVILVGENSSSIRYINQKQKWANYIGIDFELFKFDETVTEDKLIEVLNKLNLNNNISGYIVQLPLPKHINEKNIINAIIPSKDIDGFHPINQGKIVIGDQDGLTPCTPTGVLEIFNYYNIDIVGKNIVIIGRSNIVGKPLLNMLVNKSATVTICNSKTKNIDFFTKNADIVITAMGVANFLTVDKINKDTIIIDVGFSVIDGKIYGDCDFKNIENNGNKITPVPGGVGTLTVACLMKNALKAYKSNGF